MLRTDVELSATTLVLSTVKVKLFLVSMVTVCRGYKSFLSTTPAIPVGGTRETIKMVRTTTDWRTIKCQDIDWTLAHTQHTSSAVHKSLTTRVATCLRHSEIETLGELAQMSERQVLSLINFGPRCLPVVIDVIRRVVAGEDLLHGPLGSDKIPTLEMLAMRGE